MKTTYDLLLNMSYWCESFFAQQGVTQCGTSTGQPKFPIETYEELPDPTPPLTKNGQQ